MKREIRNEYAEYLAAACRFIKKETGMDLPQDTIVAAKSHSGLATIDKILGMDIYVMDMPSAYEFFIAFKADNVDAYKIQKAFIDFVDLYDLPDWEKNGGMAGGTCRQGDAVGTMLAIMESVKDSSGEMYQCKPNISECGDGRAITDDDL